ncbi:flavin reductase [Pseudorhodoplanes sp.]|uniref:flavin reductase n=1 Tax=Pseudorhodoplanes sp. TaxID=1934341 RepID=UPI00391B2FA0
MSWIDNSPVSVWERDQATAAAEAGAPIAPPEMFREAMSRLGAAVHIITTSGPAGRAGFTATAVASVSDSPPTVLVCLNRKSQITPVMRENKVFCVNTLASSEEELANVFAGRTGVFMAERFMRGDWIAMETGAPVLTNAIAALDCRVTEMKSVATHDIYFGEVAAIRLANAEKALVYHARAYKHV